MLNELVLFLNYFHDRLILTVHLERFYSSDKSYFR